MYCRAAPGFPVVYFLGCTGAPKFFPYFAEFFTSLRYDFYAILILRRWLRLPLAAGSSLSTSSCTVHEFSYACGSS